MACFAFRHAHRLISALLLASAAALSGCDLLGIESASQQQAKREADGKAVGAGCRHAARSIEQCYAMNKRADRAAVFTGWRDMNDYMRENSIAAVPPAPEAAASAAVADAGDAGADDKADAKPAKANKKDS